MPTLQVTKAQLAELERLGLVPTPGNKGKSKAKAPKWVAEAFAPPGTWTVPVETRSEKNQRQWRQKASRVQAARKAVSVAFGRRLAAVAPFAEAYHAGRTVTVKLTRLGGWPIDQWDNLPVALSGVLDAVCLMMGAEDSPTSPLKVQYDQRPGGPAGVTIELSTEGRDGG